MSKGGFVWDRTTPCASCPYRRDAPRGLWHRVEFDGVLRAEADPVMGAVYGCHEFNKRPPEEHRPCGGWLLDQKKRGVPSIQLRLILFKNPTAAKVFRRLSAKGIEMFDSIAEMCAANIGRRKAMKPREYEIWKSEGPNGCSIPGRVIAATKSEARKLARKKWGPGKYTPCETFASKCKREGIQVERKGQLVVVSRSC